MADKLVHSKSKQQVKNTGLYILVFSVVLGSILPGCENSATEETQTEIAVTNSYLQCAVHDLWAEQTNVLSLAPPGMCPGHFDISPSRLKQLCNCRILLLFDFQKRVEDSLSRMRSNGLKIGLVKTLPGLCVPETYLAICQDVCNILSSEYPLREVHYKQRLKLASDRLEALSNELLVKIKQSGLGKAKVLTSDHQAQFCKWLGLDVVATFMGSDIETISNINRCLEKARENPVRFVVANKQEGTGLANSLAQRLGAKVVVFSNFPDIASDQSGFDQLLRENVQTLLEAAKQ